MTVNMNSMGGIMPRGNKAIAVGGKVYKVHETTVTHEDRGYCLPTFAPVKGEAVYVNGKKHLVEQVPDLMACDKTKDVVYIDGKQYDVTSVGTAHLKAEAQKLTGKMFDKTA